MVTIKKSKCIGCGACVADCPVNALKMEGGKAEYNGSCILCGHCVAICPTAAVAIPEYDMAEVEPFDEKRYGVEFDNLLHTIKFRRSVREFAAKQIEQEKLDNLIQIGRYTATGGNRQGCRFVVVQNELTEFKQMIWNGIDSGLASTDEAVKQAHTVLQSLAALRADGTDFLFRNAPTVLYIAAESTVDAGLAAQNIEMAALSQGLSVLYNGYLVHATTLNTDARAWLGTDDKPIAVCMLVGYPSTTYNRTAPRRSADVNWR